MVACNRTLEDLTVDHEIPYHGGLTFHHWGLIVCAVFGLIAVVIALLLMFQHATHYTKPWEQKHIIRILFMLPVYALVSFLSYYYYLHAIYFEVIRDCYEAFAIASFFALLCNYIAPTLHEQKEYFRTTKPKNWVWPMGWIQKCSGGMDKGIFRRPQSGLTWFNICWVGVFQYCFIRVFFTIVSVASEAGNRYCQASLNPAFAHIWVMVFEGASVTIAMYCLIQFYYQIKDEIAEHKPLLKIACIKLVIFFCFWQSLVISFLVSSGAVHTSDHIAYPDLEVGIPSMLLCLEMAIFAVMHIFAFPWRKEYSILSQQSYGPHSSDPNIKYLGGRFGLKAYADAFNPWDIIKASARGFRWLFVGVRHRHTDSSYQGRFNGGGSVGSSVKGGRTSTGPTIIARPADAWPLRPDDSKVPMQPLTTDGQSMYPTYRVSPADGDLGGAGNYGRYDADNVKLSPYPSSSPYPESSRSNPFEDDTTYHGVTPLRSQEDVNEYVRAGSYRSDPFGEERQELPGHDMGSYAARLSAEEDRTHGAHSGLLAPGQAGYPHGRFMPDASNYGGQDPHAGNHGPYGR